MNFCKDCKWWERTTDPVSGECSNQHFIYSGLPNYNEPTNPFIKDKNCLYYEDTEAFDAFFYTDEEFGCIHFEPNE